jgi:hypothetical protein
VKDIEHLDLVLTHIPTKALYALQVSVMQEAQSRARVNSTNLQIDREVKEILQVTCEKITREGGGETMHRKTREETRKSIH